jgi:hypothetical protein
MTGNVCCQRMTNADFVIYTSEQVLKSEKWQIVLNIYIKGKVPKKNISWIVSETAEATAVCICIDWIMSLQ